MKRLPLTWLQAFEAAGRTGSFKAAAEELSVSASNISHQIRDLEAYLGAPLFARNGGTVELTEEGKDFLPELSAGFQSLRNATSKSVGQSIGSPGNKSGEQTGDSARGQSTLSIGAFPFLANEIITPNINALYAETQAAEIRLYTHTNLSALTHVKPTERLDIVVRYGPSNARFPGLVATKIADVALVPIIGPDIVGVSSSAAFTQQPMIRVIGPFQGWDRWLDKFAPSVAPPTFSLQTDSFHAAMLAVARSEAVCLGVLPYLRPWVRSGKVQALSEFTLPIPDQAAFAVFAPYQRTNPQVAACVAWLTAVLT